MPVCVIVLPELETASKIEEKLEASLTPIVNSQLIQPSDVDIQSEKVPIQIQAFEESSNSEPIETVKIDSVQLLNPKLSRTKRQKDMAFWLMPFGFLAGLTFTKMTGLETFSEIGLGPIGEPLIGSLLGMGSGWIGSYVAAASVNSDKGEGLNTLIKRNQEGFWLLLIETPLEIELPWQLIKELNPVDIVRLRDL